ncbi:thiamine phosphate synthase [Pikeienuella piscinae]|uniref:Thiamine-phosphate synthase n=1 Tax=Pikeienuella piscinae TaxID=2748098 RepID=A0A7L5BWM5_9RHOB|nr:thiamine phosphate synthase [Pikeienuella piscinae]QIE54646.1 thiamine phosphate synthase [Pikeienuella piscinae]
MRRRLDLSVYFITDPSARRGVEEAAVGAVRGGVRTVQLRDKTMPDADFTALGRRLHAALAPFGAALIVNDRAHLAAEIGADGVHVGQTDAAVADVRAMIGSDAILGLSIENAGQLAAVDPAMVDYLGVGPIRATATKPDHAPQIGLAEFAVIARTARLPCVAIGGVTARDAAPIRSVGGAGLAVVSAICDADNPEQAARALLDAWRRP